MCIDQHSGAWLGWSVQHGLRITETLDLQIQGGIIRGQGYDKDGDFELVGTCSSEGAVSITRRYTWTTEPTQGSVGYPYLYVGTWDGTLVSGNWCPLLHPHTDGGPFEMWPGGEESEYRLEELQSLTLSER